MQALGQVLDVIERIESAQRIAGHQQELRRFGGVGGEDQVHGAGDIGLDAVGLDIQVLGARARHFEQGLAGIHGIILQFAAGLADGVQQQAIGRAIACAETDGVDRGAEGFEQPGGFGGELLPGTAQAGECGIGRARQPGAHRQRSPIEELLRKVASLDSLGKLLDDFRFGQYDFNLHGST